MVRLLERSNGIRTSGVVELDVIGLADPERVHYKPTPWLTLRRSLPPKSVSNDDVFMDLGSGMGRVVFQAALWYPFKRVVGVELASELHRIAEDNIERNRPRLRCPEVQLVQSDVLDYTIPKDVTVVFLYNPFTGDIFKAVVRRLLASFDANPRLLRIVYFNPVEHEWLVATGRIRLRRRVRGWRPGQEWARTNSTHVYEVLPPRLASEFEGSDASAAQQARERE